MLGDTTTSVLGGGGGGGGESAAPETTNRHDGLIGDVGNGGAVAAEDNNKNSGEDERGRSGGGDDGDRSFGGNRWPRQETLALLKIRSEMDVAFRDASVKGPLWEQVARKLEELGFHRSAKKCKEKFENVYKYHKRTKEVRSGKPDSKSYKFFEQLEALENHPPLSFHTQLSQLSKPPPSPPTTVISHIPSTVPSTTTAVTHLMNISFSQPNPTIHLQSMPPPAPLPSNNPTSLAAATRIAPLFQANVSSGAAGLGFQSIEADLISNSTSDDVDSSTSSDEASRQRRKRKWKDFFERLMREVIQKQEEMQKRFLEAIEKREQERVAREEAWRMQEIAKINREKEILAQERSMAAAKDAAITSFLQKLTESHQNDNNPSQPRLPPSPPQQQLPILMSNLTPVVQPPPPPPPPPPPQQASTLQVVLPNSTPQKLMNNNEFLQMEIIKENHNSGESYTMSPASSSSRWPKVEVEALIQLRTNLEAKYQENGPKGPLWEEISSAMKRLGYNRNPKRCKEKWENINKYFKKVKESKKTRPEDSKTCPYFHQLDALYKEKNINNTNTNTNRLDNVIIASSTQIMLHQQQPLMVRPEQQWPPQQETVRPDSANEEMESEPMDRDEREADDEEEDEEEDEGGENYEIVASKPASMSVAE